MTIGTKQFKGIMIMAMLAALTLVAGLQSAGAHKDGAYSHDATIGYTNKNWMGSLPDDRLLSEISIPGTHDTMAYQITSIDPQCEVDENPTLTQSMDLETQLNSGIRFLDIRGFHWRDDLLMHHGPCYLGTDFDEVMQTVTDFLKNNTDNHGNPTETIILKVKRENSEHEGHNNETCLQVFDSIVSPYASYIYTGTTTFSPELGVLRGKILFLGDFPDWQNSPYVKTKWDWWSGTTQNEYELDCHDDLYDKWLAVKDHLQVAPFGSKDDFYINFLSGAYGGDFWGVISGCLVDPFFVASGHKNPDTDADRKETGEDDSYPATFTLYPDFPRTKCQDGSKPLQKAKCDILYEGTNILTADYLASQKTAQRVGIIIADFPGKDLIEQVIRMNLLPENQKPVADAGGPYIFDEGQIFDFDASGSTDYENDYLHHNFDYNGDGTPETEWSNLSKIQSPFFDDWSGTLIVGVHDNQGDIDDRATYDSAQVIINNVAPSIDSFDITNVYSYAEGDTLLAAHDFVNAVETYRAAAQEVQGIHDEK